jgi:hypothetical protein
VTRLRVKRVPAGATITVACTGTCPKKKLTMKVSKAAASVALKPFQKSLRAGTTITVTVTKPGMIGSSQKLSIRAGKAPRLAAVLCVRPGAATATAC